MCTATSFEPLTSFVPTRAFYAPPPFAASNPTATRLTQSDARENSHMSLPWQLPSYPNTSLPQAYPQFNPARLLLMLPPASDSGGVQDEVREYRHEDCEGEAESMPEVEGAAPPDGPIRPLALPISMHSRAHTSADQNEEDELREYRHEDSGEQDSDAELEIVTASHPAKAVRPLRSAANSHSKNPDLIKRAPNENSLPSKNCPQTSPVSDPQTPVSHGSRKRRSTEEHRLSADSASNKSAGIHSNNAHPLTIVTSQIAASSSSGLAHDAANGSQQVSGSLTDHSNLSSSGSSADSNSSEEAHSSNAAQNGLNGSFYSHSHSHSPSQFHHTSVAPGTSNVDTGSAPHNPHNQSVATSSNSASASASLPSLSTQPPSLVPLSLSGAATLEQTLLAPALVGTQEFPVPFLSAQQLQYSQAQTQGQAQGLFNPQSQTHRIKKPLNAFMIFMREQRPLVIKESELKESAAINQLLGRKWHSLTRTEQERYYELARNEKQKHLENHPEWNTKDGYARSRKRRHLFGDPNDPTGEGRLAPKKCRAVFGLANMSMWCRPCRRKKKCIRFGVSKPPVLAPSPAFALGPGAVGAPGGTMIISPNAPLNAQAQQSYLALAGLGFAPGLSMGGSLGAWLGMNAAMRTGGMPAPQAGPVPPGQPFPFSNTISLPMAAQSMQMQMQAQAQAAVAAATSATHSLNTVEGPIEAGNCQFSLQSSHWHMKQNTLVNPMQAGWQQQVMLDTKPLVLEKASYALDTSMNSSSNRKSEQYFTQSQDLKFNTVNSFTDQKPSLTLGNCTIREQWPKAPSPPPLYPLSSTTSLNSLANTHKNLGSTKGTLHANMSHGQVHGAGHSSVSRPVPLQAQRSSQMASITKASNLLSLRMHGASSVSAGFGLGDDSERALELAEAGVGLDTHSDLGGQGDVYEDVPSPFRPRSEASCNGDD